MEGLQCDANALSFPTVGDIPPGTASIHPWDLWVTGTLAPPPTPGSSEAGD